MAELSPSGPRVSLEVRVGVGGGVGWGNFKDGNVPQYQYSKLHVFYKKEVDICLFHGSDLHDQEDCKRMSFLVATAMSFDPLLLCEKEGGSFCMQGSNARPSSTALLQIWHWPEERAERYEKSNICLMQIHFTYVLCDFSILQVVCIALPLTYGAEAKYCPWCRIGETILNAEPGQPKDWNCFAA